MVEVWYSANVAARIRYRNEVSAMWLEYVNENGETRWIWIDLTQD